MRTSQIDDNSIPCVPANDKNIPTKEKISPKTTQKLPKRSDKNSPETKGIKKECDNDENRKEISESYVFRERKPIIRDIQPTFIPSFLLQFCPKVHSINRDMFCCDRSAAYDRYDHLSSSARGLSCILFGSPELESEWRKRCYRFIPVDVGGLAAMRPMHGWNRIMIPDKHSLMMDAGKLYVLDSLLSRLKKGNHRVLIYSQMTKMIDLLEEYMWHRQHKYMRLDGSSKISDRRDMVDDFQNKCDIFVFLLSTRAGGVGINLTAADTVIFYDSDWNPTVDQQAMDRAHRLGQTKQVTVYRLVCKSTIEERMLQRATEKSEIQRMVISGTNLKIETLKPKEVVSLLLDEDIEKQYHTKQQEKRLLVGQKLEKSREKIRLRMRKRYAEKKLEREEVKRRKLEDEVESVDMTMEDARSGLEDTSSDSDSSLSESPMASINDEVSSEPLLIADRDSPAPSTCPVTSDSPVPLNQPVRGQRKRGRPRGSGIRGRANRFESIQSISSTSQDSSTDVAATSASKRGRGRPRIFPLGPGHIGTRSSTSLPVALGSHLNPNLSKEDNSTKNHFGFSS